MYIYIYIYAHGKLILQQISINSLVAGMMVMVNVHRHEAGLGVRLMLHRWSQLHVRT
jgi:hypothetical protein